VNKVRGVPFKPGHKFAKGGRHGGNQGGRPPDWYKRRCAELLDRHDLFKFLSDVAKGKKEELHITQFGRVLLTRAKVRDRIQAIAELRDTAHGRPGSNMDITSGGKPLSSLPDILDEARKRSGL